MPGPKCLRNWSRGRPQRCTFREQYIPGHGGGLSFNVWNKDKWHWRDHGGVYTSSEKQGSNKHGDKWIDQTRFLKLVLIPFSLGISQPLPENTDINYRSVKYACGEVQVLAIVEGVTLTKKEHDWKKLGTVVTRVPCISDLYSYLPTSFPHFSHQAAFLWGQFGLLSGTPASWWPGGTMTPSLHSGR